MDTSSINGLFDLLIAGAGAYILFVWFSMKRTGEIKGGMFLPNGITPEKCRDKAGYIAYISPKLLLLGIVTLVCGLCGLGMDYAGIIPGNVYLILMVIFMVTLVWYATLSRKAVGQYWGK